MGRPPSSSPSKAAEKKRIQREKARLKRTPAEAEAARLRINAASRDRLQRDPVRRKRHSEQVQAHKRRQTEKAVQQALKAAQQEIHLEAGKDRLLLKEEAQRNQQNLLAAQAQVAALQAHAQAEKRQRRGDHDKQLEQERKRVADFCRLQAALASKDRHIRVLTRNCDKYEQQTQELQGRVSHLSDTGRGQVRGGMEQPQACPKQARCRMDVEQIAVQEQAVWEHIEQMVPELRPLVVSFEQVQQPGFEMELGKGRDVVIYGPAREVLVWYRDSFRNQLMGEEDMRGAGSSQMESRALSCCESGSATRGSGESGSSMSSLGDSQHEMEQQESIQGQSRPMVCHGGHNSMGLNERSKVEDGLVRGDGQGNSTGEATEGPQGRHNIVKVERAELLKQEAGLEDQLKSLAGTVEGLRRAQEQHN